MMMFRGGGENYDQNLSEELLSRGLKTELYTLVPVFRSPTFDFPMEFGAVNYIKSPWLYPITARIHSIPILRKFKGFRGIPRFFGQLIFELRCCIKLWKRRKENFVIHTCELPLVSFFSASFLHKQSYIRMPGPIASIYESSLAPRATGIIANGNAYEQIGKMRGIYNLHKIDVGVKKIALMGKKLLNSSIDNLQISRTTKIVLFVGRLVGIKNVPLILNACNHLRELNIQVVIVGDGPEKKKLMHLANRLQLRHSVVFAGHASKSQLADFFSLADVLVLPSFYDNFPNVLIEGMQCGLPCIGSDVGGIPEIIQDDVNGFVFKSNNCEALASCIKRVVTEEIKFSPSLIKASVEKFSWVDTADSFLRLIETNTN